MERRVVHGVELDFAGQHALVGTGHGDVVEPVGKAAALDLAEQFAEIDGNHQRLRLAAIDDGGYAALAAHGPGRTLAGALLGLGCQCGDFGHPSFSSHAAPGSEPALGDTSGAGLVPALGDTSGAGLAPALSGTSRAGLAPGLVAHLAPGSRPA